MRHLRIHKEGRKTILNLLVNLMIVNGLLYFISLNEYAFGIINILSILIFAYVVYFFRNPIRELVIDDELVFSPADGKVITVEEVKENEYSNDWLIQVSLQMSPINMHVTRVPISGVVKFFKFIKDDSPATWYPKPAKIKEQTTVAIETSKGSTVIIKQKAGVFAGCIVCYTKEGGNLKQGDDLGFIKYGSKVDLFLPKTADIKVKIGDLVKGNETIIAKLN